VVTKISATMRPGGIGRAAASKEVFENTASGIRAEYFAKNFERIVKAATPARTEPARARIKGSMTILIVSGALLRIAQRFVGFADLLELFFGGFVAGVLVRVVFDREFAIGLFYFLDGDGPLDAEHFVI